MPASKEITIQGQTGTLFEDRAEVDLDLPMALPGGLKGDLKWILDQDGVAKVTFHFTPAQSEAAKKVLQG